MKNVKLTNLEAYKGKSDEWYLKIIYQYENEDELHQRVFPRVIPPFPQGDIPVVSFADDPFNDINNENYLVCNDRMVLWPGSYSVKLADGEIDLPQLSCMVDVNLSNHEPKEMTLDEIEKKLGYRIKIVSENSKKNKKKQ